MHDNAQFAGDIERIAGRIVDAVGKKNHGGNFAGANCFEAVDRARTSDVALPVGVNPGRLWGAVERLRPARQTPSAGGGNRPSASRTIFHLAAGLVEPRDARGVIGNAHRRRGVEQEDKGGFFD